jgi:hypothetical protein
MFVKRQSRSFCNWSDGGQRAQETAKLRISHWHRECNIAVKAKQLLYLS